MTMKLESRTIGTGQTVDAYLGALRKQLWELTDADANDIVEEIRIHILDRTADEAPAKTVSDTLAALGKPAELADRYRTEEMLARGRAARSPTFVARSVGRWALLTLGGLLVFSFSVVGYGLGGWLFLLGGMKLIFPGTTGVYGTWTQHDSSFRWQSGGPNTPDELLGWWLVPIGLIVGGTLLMLTFRFGNWSIRKFWRPRRWQGF